MGEDLGVEAPSISRLIPIDRLCFFEESRGETKCSTGREGVVTALKSKLVALSCSGVPGRDLDSLGLTGEARKECRRPFADDGVPPLTRMSSLFLGVTFFLPLPAWGAPASFLES